MPCRANNLGPFILVMVLISLAVSFSFQGSRGLYETSEGRYAECAREMVERGNYLEPTLGYRPHWSKPPLTYWAIAMGIKLFGPNEWGVRLFGSLAFFLTTLIVAFMGATLWDKKTGIIAGLIYTTSLFPVAGSFAVTADTLLTFWELSAVLGYLKACRVETRKKQDLWIIVMWLSLGFGFLTKGPPSLIVLIPVLIWHFRMKRPVRLANPIGIVLFIVTGFSWYLLVCYRHPELLSYFLGKEVVGRVASNSVHHHEWYGAFEVYIPVLLLGGGLWSYFEFKLAIKKRLFIPKVFWTHLRGTGYSSFLMLWILLPLILFSLVKSRLPLYILPLYGPTALLIARGLRKGANGPVSMKKIFLAGMIAFLVIVAIKGAASYYPSKNNMKTLYDMCMEAKGKDSRFALFNDSRLYGLQYYLDGKLERISPGGGEPWADGSLGDIISKVNKASSPLSYVIVSREQESPLLSKMLKRSGISFKMFGNRNWILYRIGDSNPGS